MSEEACKTLQMGPNLLHLKALITLIENIDYSISDLIKLLEKGSHLGKEKYLFLVNYYSIYLEYYNFCGLLMALKVLFPKNVFFLRYDAEIKEK